MSRRTKSSSNTPNEYVALIGDMVGSRRVEDFASAVRALEDVLQEVNERFAPASRLLVTLGDEFQGLFHAWAPLSAVLRLVDERMHPHRFRYGLARGPITSGPLAEVALGMYGPCFTDARRALDRARTEGLSLAVDGVGPLGPVIEAQALLLDTLRQRWTDNMRDTVALRRSHPRQRDVALVLGKSPSVVSESLKAAGWPAMERGERSLEVLFGLLDGAGEG